MWVCALFDTGEAQTDVVHRFFFLRKGEGENVIVSAVSLPLSVVHREFPSSLPQSFPLFPCPRLQSLSLFAISPVLCLCNVYSHFCLFQAIVTLCISDVCVCVREYCVYARARVCV